MNRLLAGLMRCIRFHSAVGNFVLSFFMVFFEVEI